VTGEETWNDYEGVGAKGSNRISKGNQLDLGFGRRKTTGVETQQKKEE